MTKSAMEQMVEWLEDTNPNEISPAEVLDYARRLLLEEQAQKPTAPASMVDGNTSDGYHTFNELYDHRIALYLDIVSQNSEWFWKSKKHEDGSCFEGWFILGGNMGTGDISYHIPMDKWEMAKCREIPFGKKWDGHKPEDVVKRVLRHSQAPNTSHPSTAKSDRCAETVQEIRQRVTDYFYQSAWPTEFMKYAHMISDKMHDILDEFSKGADGKEGR